jgi:hypothetical protein
MAAAQSPAVTLVDTAVLVAPGLRESSGVAASRRHPGLFWTHNDSGDGPFLYVTDTSGADLGAIRLAGARAYDWEDIAAGPCVVTDQTCLYVGDIGDNFMRRSHVVLYRVVEPDPLTARAAEPPAVPILDSLTLRFPDGAHDAEGLAVTPDGWLLVVTKDRGRPARLYRARLDATRWPVIELNDAGVLAMETGFIYGRLVTGADVSHDGRLLVVRTYVSLHLFALESGGMPRPLLDRNGLPIPVVEDQGEGVAFDADGRLVLTSERSTRNHAILTRLSVTGLH